MRLATGYLALALGACVYGEPTVGEGFKCDATHTCPAGQECMMGICDDESGILFQSGWENRTELGCDLDALVDRDYTSLDPGYRSSIAFADTSSFDGLCTAANGSAAAEIVEDIGPHDGLTRMLRVRQATDEVNGTAFFVGQLLSEPQKDFYASWWVKYSDNWMWSDRDHNVFGTGEVGVDVSVRVRGHRDGSPGTISIHILAGDSTFDASASQMSVGVWHFCELYVHSDPANGKVMVWIDNEPVPFPELNEAKRRILDVNTGTPTTGGRLDTTYHDATFIDDHMSPADPWFVYYDDIRMGTIER